MKKLPFDFPPNTDRRQILQGIVGMALAAATARVSAQKLPTAQVNTTKLAVTDTEVTVGQLHSATGTMAISETGSIQAEQLAIDQINAMGGVLGRQIKVIKEDGASDWPTFAEKAKKLLINDHVATVFGCWTSASRKAVLPIFEKENGMLYYPTFYEGLEQSKNVIYTGQEATQQILWGLDWAAKEKGTKTYFLVGSDYIWPRTSMKIARKHIENNLKQKVVGEEFYPLGNTNFNSLINKIKAAKPDLIYAAVVGGSNVAFYKQLKAAGVTAKKQFLLTISVTEDEVLGIGGGRASRGASVAADDDGGVVPPVAWKDRLRRLSSVMRLPNSGGARDGGNGGSGSGSDGPWIGGGSSPLLSTQRTVDGATIVAVKPGSPTASP